MSPCDPSSHGHANRALYLDRYADRYPNRRHNADGDTDTYADRPC